VKKAKLLGKEMNLEAMRLSIKEAEDLAQVFESTATEGYIENQNFRKRMGLAGASDAIFVDAFFRVFEKYSQKPGVVDLRAFLTGLSFLLKGGVEDKLQFAFELFDANGDGFVELKDMYKLTKSALTSAVYLAESCRGEWESDETIQMKTKAYDISLHYSDKNLCVVRTDIAPAEQMAVRVKNVHWPFVKEIVEKRFKDMDKSGKNKVGFKDFSKYWFTKFPDVDEFLGFYASILQNGYRQSMAPSQN